MARDAKGFTLIEVVISVGILMTLTIAVASTLKSGFDIRAGLSERAKMLHRLNTAITKIASDIQFGFYVSAKDAARNGIDRTAKTLFRIDKSLGDKLALTTATHRPRNAMAQESEFTYVTYELIDAKDASGRKHLVRSEAGAIPVDLKEPQIPSVLARHIKEFKLQAWNGDRWTDDYWDTGRGDTRNLLPRMVKVTIEAWLHERKDGDGTPLEGVDEATDKISTVVYLTNAAEFKELKEPDKSIKWGNL